MEEGLVWWEPMAECSNGVRRRARSEDMGGEGPDGDLPPSDVGVEVDLPPPRRRAATGSPTTGPGRRSSPGKRKQTTRRAWTWASQAMKTGTTTNRKNAASMQIHPREA